MERVTHEQVVARVEDEEYVIFDRSVICKLKLKCGHIVIGEAHCQPSTNYSFEIGKSESYLDAINKAFDLEVYYQRNKGRTE